MFGTDTAFFLLDPLVDPGFDSLLDFFIIMLYGYATSISIFVETDVGVTYLKCMLPSPIWPKPTTPRTFLPSPVRPFEAKRSRASSTS